MDRTRILIVASIVVVCALVGVYYYEKATGWNLALMIVLVALLIVFAVMSGYLVQTSRLTAGGEKTQRSTSPRPTPEAGFDPWMRAWREVTQDLPQEFNINLPWFFGNGLLFVLLGALSLHNVLYPQPYMVMPAIWGITIGLLLVAAYFFLRLLLLVDTKVVLSPTGVQYISSRASWQVGWDEIERVREKWIVSNIPFRNIHHLYLTTREGREMRLDQRLQNMDGLADTFRKVWTTKKMPGALNALDRGSTLDFHPFTLSNQGIGYKGKLLPVQDVETETYGGFIRIKSHRKYWASQKAANVTNVSLFLRLLHHLRNA
jgi:hypothetical protein